MATAQAIVSVEDEFINVAVPRRLYGLVIRTMADAMAREAHELPKLQTEKSPDLPERAWTAEDVRHLNLIVTNPTVRALMDMTCKRAGTRVSFREVFEHVGRNYGQARADLAGFTKLIQQRFNRSNWPVHVKQGADGTLTYDAAPEIAAAWTATK